MSNTLSITQFPKAKAAFEEWFTRAIPDFYKDLEKGLPQMPYYVFKVLPFQFQQGVYMAFLREHKISVESYLILSGDWVGEVITIHSSKELLDRLQRVFKCTKPDYDSALIAAIEAAFQKLEAELP